MPPAEAQYVAGTAESMRFQRGAFRLRYVAAEGATEVYLNEPLCGEGVKGMGSGGCTTLMACSSTS